MLVENLYFCVEHVWISAKDAFPTPNSLLIYGQLPCLKTANWTSVQGSLGIPDDDRTVPSFPVDSKMRDKERATGLLRASLASQSSKSESLLPVHDWSLLWTDQPTFWGTLNVKAAVTGLSDSSLITAPSIWWKMSGNNSWKTGAQTPFYGRITSKTPNNRQQYHCPLFRIPQISRRFSRAAGPRC